MFAAGPPPPSAAEIRLQELEAKNTLQTAITTCVLLYFSPFVISYVNSFI